MIETGIAIGCLLAGIGIGYLLAIQSYKHENIRYTEMQKNFKALASDAIKGNSEDFLIIASEKFKTLSNETDLKLEGKKALIDQRLDSIGKTLNELSEKASILDKGLVSTLTLRFREYVESKLFVKRSDILWHLSNHRPVFHIDVINPTKSMQ